MAHFSIGMLSGFTHMEFALEHAARFIRDHAFHGLADDAIRDG